MDNIKINLNVQYVKAELYSTGWENSSSFGCCLLHAGFLLGLIFNTEDGCSLFL
jgi:hypothetical protein